LPQKRIPAPHVKFPGFKLPVMGRRNTVEKRLNGYQGKPFRMF
jgi:hypothetical protein